MQKFKECLQKLNLILNHDLNKYSINLFVIAVGSIRLVDQNNLVYVYAS